MKLLLKIQLRFLYIHEAAFEDTVKIFAFQENDKYDFRTVNQEGKTCLEAEILF